METQPARSQAETVKEASRHLRGSILQELSVEGPFSKETVQILKFHGMYQQQDRDARKRGEAVHGSMVRVGIPGGVLSAEQYLALDRLADEFVFFDRTIYGLCKLFERMGARARLRASCR